MTYIVKQDQITNRTYYQIENGVIAQELIDRVDFSNLVLASHNGYTRFLLNDATLVMVKTNNPFGVHTSLMAHAPAESTAITAELHHNTFTVSFSDIHSSISIDCITCDDGKEHNYHYDFSPSGEIEKNKPYLAESNTIDMAFHLTDHQARSVLTATSALHDLNQRGQYKFIDEFQNCVSLPINTYRNSELPHHLSYFYTDDELLSYDFIGKTVFKDRLYHPDNLSDLTRPEVSAFMKEVYGDDYAGFWKNDRGNGTIAEKKVDSEKAMANPVIMARIERLTELRKEYYGEFVKIWGKGFNITEDHIKPFVEREFTNEELYYTYISKFELEQHKLFASLPYAPHLNIVPFGMDLAKSCFHNEDTNSLYAPLCQALCTKLTDGSLVMDEESTTGIKKFCNNWDENGACPPVEYADLSIHENYD